jgi:protein-tyrosine-phosphatase/ribosomal protein S27AE
MTMAAKCPGAVGVRTPTIITKKCPECGREVEILSNEMQTRCTKCGFTIYNNLESCVQWCKHARECVGEEVYKKLKRKRIAFVCLGNAARSQMAEALARKLSNRPNVEFVSMGTNPAREVDPRALEVLKEANIIWQGKPKGIQDKEPIDVVVTMGYEVECPVIPCSKRIDWDILDPKGKDVEDYRKMLGIIKEKVMELLKEVD